MKKWIKNSLLLYVFSFLLNFLWESLHSFSLYECCKDLLINVYVTVMLHVSNVDALIIVGIFLIGILIFRNPNWFFKYNRIKITYFVLSSLLVAIFIEIRAVYFLDKWQYSEFMPLVFGIGLSPLVQLTITGLISLYIVKRLK